MKKVLGMGLVLGIGLIFIGCERTVKLDWNYRYQFSGVVGYDRLDRPIIGSHWFILDKRIADPNGFRECYVNYLDWSGLDPKGDYKKYFYMDRKMVKIEFKERVWGRRTVDDADICNGK